MMMSTLAVLAVSMFVGVTADLSLCGEYTTPCQVGGGGDNPNVPALSGSLNFVGSVAGTFKLVQYQYSNLTTCGSGNADFNATIVGDFQDFGAQNATGYRLVMMNISTMDIVPLSADGVKLLQTACDCNGKQWQQNTSTSIGPGDCPTKNGAPTCNVQMFVGGITTIGVNSPFYLLGEPDATSIATTQASVSSAIGWEHESIPPFTLSTRNASCSATSEHTLCGEYETVNQCEIILNPFNNTPVGSAYTHFAYRGPLGNDMNQPVTGAYGVYNRTRSFYDDFNCQQLRISTYEYGSLGIYSTDTNGPNYVVQRQPSNMIITPQTDAERDYLNDQCTCSTDNGAKPWTTGRPRLLTICPQHTCTSMYWNDFLPLGSLAYAYVSRNDTSYTDTEGEEQAFQHIAFSLWRTTEALLNGLDVEYAMSQVLDSSMCSSNSYSGRYCGMYKSWCSISGTQLFDTVSSVTLSGSYLNSSVSTEGMIESEIQFWKATDQCAGDNNLDGTILSKGLFVAGAEANVVGVSGVSSIEVDFTSYQITPNTQYFTDFLNNATTGCPCGETWVKGQTRTINRCTTGQCSDNFMLNYLPAPPGVPSFGVVQLNLFDQGLRMSPLSSDKSTGYSEQFAADTTIYYNQASCPEWVNSLSGSELSGCWKQLCYRVGGPTGLALDVSATVDILAPNDDAGPLFTINKTVYPAGSGCTNQYLARSWFTIDVQGEYTLDDSDFSNSIVGGKLLKIIPFNTTITADSAAGVQFLNSNCSCGTFVLFVPGTLDSPCRCADLEALVGFPVGQTGYGVVKRWSLPNDYPQEFGGSDFIRTTKFSDKVPASDITFTNEDGEYTTTDEYMCPLEPHRPDRNAGPQGLDGGYVFILLVFCSFTLYCGIGMGLNYQRTGGMKNGGTPVIPHISFWRALPGLITDGFRFTFLDFCGLRGRGGGSTYDSPFGHKGGDYGAL